MSPRRVGYWRWLTVAEPEGEANATVDFGVCMCVWVCACRIAFPYSYGAYPASRYNMAVVICRAGYPSPTTNLIALPGQGKLQLKPGLGEERVDDHLAC